MDHCRSGAKPFIMYKFLFTAAFLFFFLLFAAAQDVLPPGLLWDDASYDALPPYSVRERVGTDREKSLLSYCPKAGNQCDQNSCVAWAISYAMTIRLAIQCRKTDQLWITDHFFSPAFIYNQAKAAVPCDTGAYLKKALELVSVQGVCFERSFPYECQNCTKMPGSPQRQEASLYKITAAQRLFRSNESDKNKIDSTLTALSNDNPVLVALKDPVDTTAGHALVVIGYDENAKTFTLLNSYGEGWGSSGCFKLSFAEFARRARYGILLSMGRVKCR